MIPEQAALAEIEARLRARKVSPEIVARVLRLNQNARPGHRLRGIHYKEDPRWIWGLVSRGECIRRFGREWVEALRCEDVTKFGRRAYVHMRAVEDRAPA